MMLLVVNNAQYGLSGIPLIVWHCIMYTQSILIVIRHAYMYMYAWKYMYILYMYIIALYVYAVDTLLGI